MSLHTYVCIWIYKYKCVSIIMCLSNYYIIFYSSILQNQVILFFESSGITCLNAWYIASTQQMFVKINWKICRVYYR